MNNIEVLLKINKKVKYLASLYKIKDKKLIKDLCFSCLDEYCFLLANCNDENEAYEKAISVTTKEIKELSKDQLDNRIYTFSVFVSFTTFFYSLFFYFVDKITLIVFVGFQLLYLLLLVVILGFFVYCLMTHKKRNLIDYIVISILFVSILIFTVQDLIYLFQIKTGRVYYHANYIFIGIIKFEETIYLSENSNKSINTYSILFDPTLIMSFICVIASLINKFRNKRNK